jgi:two-component system response regulator AtoC
MVEQGRFRADLFYRLNVVRFRLPALRERREEIPALVRRFLSRFSVESGKVGVQVAEDTLEHLLLYSWPGNVRQLAHELERMLAFAESGTVLRPEHLSPEIREQLPSTPHTEPASTSSVVCLAINRRLNYLVRDVECAAIAHALRESDGRPSDAAKRLGLSRKGLYLKRKRLGL